MEDFARDDQALGREDNDSPSVSEILQVFPKLADISLMVDEGVQSYDVALASSANTDHSQRGTPQGRILFPTNRSFQQPVAIASQLVSLPACQPAPTQNRARPPPVLGHNTPRLVVSQSRLNHASPNKQKATKTQLLDTKIMKKHERNTGIALEMSFPSVMEQTSCTRERIWATMRRGRLQYASLPFEAMWPTMKTIEV